ncbi:MAG: hypothetical protein D3910_24870, partial [Candidatus Electrothrix sp. ATG2]|nr:hypothetical protein [Candidatus Electrothrix sp. ATG2]
MVMDGLQELSGADSPLGRGGKKLAAFWEALLTQEKITGIKSDLRPGEQLCAVAFIKRRFSRYFDQVYAPMPNAGWILNLKKWDMNTARPSVVYMAAVHWLEKMVKKANEHQEVEKELKDFHKKACRLTGGDYTEWDNDIQCIKKALQDCPNQSIKKWTALDGNVFFEHALDNVNIFPDRPLANEVKRHLLKLRKLAKLPRPSPFYAVLMMDGDSLGS